MEVFEYQPRGVCSSKIILTIEDDIVKDVKIIGGCPGNGLGVRALCQNQKIDTIINKLNGIECGFKGTSCPDQLAKALIEYKDKK